jgi:putative ubiquitin-RnfH superfamily antitoxin RatB of RatAB toxin-antitoxin module
MADLRASVTVEVVYAQAERAIRKVVSLPCGSRVADALLEAAGDARFESVDLGDATLGIWGLIVGRDQVLADGDRIEIYRPLAEDPKTARRNRARGLQRRTQ